MKPHERSLAQFRRFGQSLTDSDIHALLRGVPGVAMVGRVYFLMVVDLRKDKLHDQEIRKRSDHQL